MGKEDLLLVRSPTDAAPASQPRLVSNVNVSVFCTLHVIGWQCTLLFTAFLSNTQNPSLIVMDLQYIIRAGGCARKWVYSKPPRSSKIRQCRETNRVKRNLGRQGESSVWSFKTVRTWDKIHPWRSLWNPEPS